ncbi:MAG: C25 family cysteine peptidase [Calditrichota bacterium]
MNRLRLVLGLLLLVGLMAPVWAAAPIALSANDNVMQVTRNDDNGFDFTLSFATITSFDVTTPNGAFTEISIPEWGASQRIGEPQLPVLRRIFEVPLGASVDVTAAHFDTEEITLAERGIQYPLMPVQPSVSKSQSPEDVPFEYRIAAYQRAGYGDQPLVRVEELGIMRGARLFVLVVEPVRYDPTRQTLEVNNHLEIAVRFTGADWAATDDLRARTASPYFESVYQQFAINYRHNDALDEDLTRYPVKYVIISAPLFEAQLQPFIEWKIKKGYEVIVGYTDDPQVGTTTTSIKNYLQTLYNAGTPESPAPTFVLFVGDVAEIPAYSGLAGSHSTDLHYVRLDGLTNYLPEMYYGRFSASSTTDLQPQIDKTLEYEQYLMPDPSYLERVVMIAGVDASYGQVWANGQINYGTTYYFNASHGITSNTYLYPGSGSSDAQIVANASEGRGYINYTAHGSQTSWADPTFTITNINSLANNHKYGTVVGNCCLTNSFQVTTCFGEAWLRAANKGAIGYIGGTNNTYWDEDYWWGVGYRSSVVEYPTYSASALGAYDRMFHDHGETFGNWYTVQYAFIMAGNLAVTQSGSSLINYYWEIYSLMGDPSLSTFLGVPSANSVSYPPQLLIGQTSLTVNADPYSYVGLSYSGELIAAGLVGETGSLALTFDPFTTPGDADLVITRQNRIPAISTVQIIPNAGPFLNVTAVDVTDENEDDIAAFGETLAIDVEETNVGSEDAAGVTVTLASADPYLTFTHDEEFYGTIGSGLSVSNPGAFTAELSPNVPDGQVIHVDIAAADNSSNEWNNEFTITAHAPALSVSSSAVDDAAGNDNGVIDPGESVNLTLTLLNDGSVDASTLVGTLSTDYSYATITQTTGTLAVLNYGATGTLTAFGVTISPSAPGMDLAYFYLEVAMAGGRTENMIIELGIGGFNDGVENGQGSWTHAANQTGWSDQWHISTETAHSPTHAWKCGDTGTSTYASHMDAVLTTPTINLAGHSELRFWHQINGEVSSYYPDSAYDGGILEISVNGGAWTQMTPTTGGYNKYIRCTAGGSNPYSGPFTCRIPCWSGAITWSEVVCDLAAYSGNVQFRFRFGSDNGGGLEGWYVDDIRINLVAGNNPPLNLAAVIVESSAELTWESPASGALDAALLGYNIYREGIRIDSLIPANHYTDDLSALPYDVYTYRVSAQYDVGESSLSDPAAVDWQGATIGQVTDLVVSCDGDDIILRWTPVDGATEYHVYASDNPTAFEGIPVVVTDHICTLTGEVTTYGIRFYVVMAAR